MTQDEIIQMAKQIANTFGTRMCDENGDTHGEELYCMDIEDIVDTIKLVAAKEREEVERLQALCQEMLSELYVYRASEYLKDVTAAIRARGKA